MMTKKILKSIPLYALEVFNRFDWIRYYEKKPFFKSDGFIDIVFKYENKVTVTIGMTEKEYLHWRRIKPQLINQKIGEKLK